MAGGVAGSGVPLPLVLVSLALLGLSLLLFILKQRSATKQVETKPVKSARPSIEVKDGGEAKPAVRILYGTQTGTAERFSKQIGNELRQKYGDSTLVEVIDLENYKAQSRLAKEKLVIFLMATYGDGEPTDNAADFYNWLLAEADAVDKGEKEAPLKGVSYAVFGLGNKQYEHFCAVGKKVSKSMRALGAAEVCRRGDGDDDACIDDDLDKWKDELYAALDASSDLLGSKVDQAAAAANGGGAKHAVPTYDVQMHKAGTREAQPFPQGDGTSASHPYWAKLATVRELHASASDRSCVHVEIDISGCRGLSYSHGDHVGVYAQNGPQVVEAVAALLQQPLDTVFTLRRPDGDAAGSADLPDPFPGPLSLRTALSYFADVTSSPHKEALLALAEFATEPSEAERLRRLGSHDGKQDYADYVAKPHRSLLEVMTEFKSARPSLGAFFGVIAPRLQPRYYSISSSPRQHPASVHVTCAVVRSAMPTGRVHDGICSTWFQRATAGARVPVFIRSSHFRLPADPAAPVVMVGPGTGLAPFRGFLQERAALAAAGAKLGPAHLFFGCRSRGHDYIYEEELAAALKAGWLSHLHVAFSRDQASKDYVQHHVAAHAAEVWAVLSHPGGAAYVCGDAKHMAKDVHRALIQVVQDHKRCSGTQAEGFVKELQDAGRYLRDVW